jgi:hypothetical protein
MWKSLSRRKPVSFNALFGGIAARKMSYWLPDLVVALLASASRNAFKQRLNLDPASRFLIDT